MKWVTLICLLLCTLVTESRHLKKRDAEHHPREIGKIFFLIGKTNFKHLLLAILAQTFQKCSVEEHMKEVDKITKFAEHCVDHENEGDCKKSMMTIFHDKVCAIPKLDEAYPWTRECCPKAEPDRDKCFHDHRDIEVGPYKKPDAEAACKLHKDHPEDALHYYIDTIAKRHASLYPPAVLAIAGQYSTAITECCAEKERETCFNSKFDELQKTTHFIESTQRHICHILKKFPEGVSQGLKLAKLSQKYSSADLEVLKKLTVEYVHVSKDCCSGDEFECMLERLEYNQHTCDNQEKISASIKICCGKPILERASCLKDLPKDPVPEGLSDMKEYLEDAKVCKQFEDHQDDFEAKFTYDMARRNPDFPTISIQRIVKHYKGLLTKCCAVENSVECLKIGNELLETGVKESQNLLKKNCEFLEKVGEHGFIVQKLSDYVKKMPTVTDKTLLEIVGKMTKIGLKCCALPENQRMSCSEGKLDLLLGEMCEKQEQKFINYQVHHCCNDNFVERRPCFTKLGPDPSYKPLAFHESDFQVGAEICEGSEQEQHITRFYLIIYVLKMKPDITTDKMHGIMDEFTKAREKCCATEDKKLCFDIERPIVLAHLKLKLEE